MNKKFSTLLASVLLAGSVGAFAQAVPDNLKTGDVVLIKNSIHQGPQGDHPWPTYLKAKGEKGIVPVEQASFIPATAADIDSISWKVTVRENAGGLKDYAFENVATGVKLAYDAPAKTVDYAGFNQIKASTDSAKVVTATDANAWWSLDAYDDTNTDQMYTLAYRYTTEAGDSIVALGSYRWMANKEDYMVRTARLAKAKDQSMRGALAGLVGATTTIQIASFAHWQLDKDGVENLKKTLINMTYADLKLPVIQSTNIPGLANFQVVPVKNYANGDITFFGATENADAATQFVFLPASQIGLENPEYFTIDTARYRLESVHQDAVFGYGLDTDTIIKKAETKERNGLKVFSMSYLVGNPDSVTFTPAAVVAYDAAKPYFKVINNADGVTVLGAAVLEDKVLVSTVVKADATRKEGTLMPYAFEAPVYPEIAEGYYFFQSTNKATADKYIVNSLCGTAVNSYREFVDEVSADNSYNVWVVEGEGKDMTIKNRYTGEDFSLILFEAGEGLYTTGKLDTFKIETIEDIKKGGVDYYQIETPEYKKFALSLVNGIGENIYVTTVADSVLGVKVDDASLLLYPTVKETKKYGVNDELVAETYTFKTKDGKVLTRNAKGQLIIDEEEGAYPVIFAFKNAGNGEYFAVYNVLTGTMASQTAETVWYLNAQATDNYMQYVSGVGCPEGQDRFTLEAPAAPKYLTVAPGHYTIKTDGREDMLTMGADSAAIFRRITSDLKSDYNKESFALWIDTAKFDAGETPLNVPTYFIMKGAAYEEDTLAGNFLGAYRTDSVMFVEAKRVATKDTLVIASTEKALKNDAVKPYQFKFPFVDGEEGAVYVQNENNKYLRIINEYVTLTDKEEEAIAVNVVTTDTPTDNEEIVTSEVTVIAQDGAVRIANAEGKKVVITNILGQTVANTVITSSDATIAAPQGVVVVAVEGEEAVKAIVK